VLYVDHDVRAERFGHFESTRVFPRPGDNDAIGASLLGRHDATESLLTRTLDQHGRRVADTGVHDRPLNAVGHRRGQPGFLR
jgi:hypothetical protein